MERILDWLQQRSPNGDQNGVISSEALTLLSRIDYGQLNSEEMNKIIQGFSNLNLAQIIRDKMSLCDISTKVRDKHGLRNLRGMQLCIVKVP